MSFLYPERLTSHVQQKMRVCPFEVFPQPCHVSVRYYGPLLSCGPPAEGCNAVRGLCLHVLVVHEERAEGLEECEVVVSCRRRVSPFDINMVEESHAETLVELVNVAYGAFCLAIHFSRMLSELL